MEFVSLNFMPESTSSLNFILRMMYLDCL